MYVCIYVIYIYISAGRRFPGMSPLLIVQCKEIILETTYKQQNGLSQLYLYVCAYTHIQTHTHICSNNSAT